MRFSFVSLSMIFFILGSIWYVFFSIKSLIKLGKYQRKGVPTKGRLIDPPAIKKDSGIRVQMTYIIDGSSVQGESDELLTYNEKDISEKFSADTEYDILADPEKGTFVPVDEIKKQRKGYLLSIPVCIAIAAGLLYFIFFGIRIPLIDKIFELIRGY